MGKRGPKPGTGGRPRARVAQPDASGYVRITVDTPSGPKRVREHRRVAEAGEFDGIWVVDHIDGNRSHNHPDNLRLVRHIDNNYNKEGTEYRAFILEGHVCSQCQGQ